MGAEDSGVLKLAEDKLRCYIEFQLSSHLNSSIVFPQLFSSPQLCGGPITCALLAVAKLSQTILCCHCC